MRSASTAEASPTKAAASEPDRTIQEPSAPIRSNRFNALAYLPETFPDAHPPMLPPEPAPMAPATAAHAELPATVPQRVPASRGADACCAAGPRARDAAAHAFAAQAEADLSVRTRAGAVENAASGFSRGARHAIHG
jgi:hypothetical protein